MKRALVTGAGGFIGGKLVARLAERGCSGRALFHRSVGDVPSGWETIRGDVRNLETMRAAAAGADVVFHLAAAGEETEDAAVVGSVNLEGTRTVVEACLHEAIPKLVVFSTVKVMGESTRGCVDESASPEPSTEYGRSKLAAERIALAVDGPGSIRVTVLRLPMVYSEDIRGNMARMIAAIDRWPFPPLPKLENPRSIVHVRNVIEAALLAAQPGAGDGETYFVTDERAWTTRELYEQIASALGRTVPQWSIPRWTLIAAGRLGDLARRVTGRNVLPGTDEIRRFVSAACFRSDRIAAELGYRPVVSFPEALPEIVARYRESQAVHRR
jgi:UDP-glucose 4-epimerase